MSKELVKQDDFGGLLSPEEAEELFGNTTGRSDNPMDSISIYRQGKEDYFNLNDEKVPEVIGVFLMSQRPMRAFWHPSKEMDGSAPTCWSIDGEAPSPNSDEPECEKCSDCTWNKLGTAKVGRGKACKTKASDFVLTLARWDEQDDGSAVITPGYNLGGGLIQYSIANKNAGVNWQTFLRKSREIAPLPQLVVAKWGFESAQSKSGVKFSTVKIDVLAPINVEESAEFFTHIKEQLQHLKGGAANEILSMLSGSNNDDSE